MSGWICAEQMVVRRESRRMVKVFMLRGYAMLIAASMKFRMSRLPSRFLDELVKNLGRPSQNSLMEWRNASWFLRTAPGLALSDLVKARTNGTWDSISHWVNRRSMSCGGSLESMRTKTQRRPSRLRR